MSDNQPQGRDADDARADDAPPTDVVSDEVREEAAAAEEHAGDSEDLDD